MKAINEFYNHFPAEINLVVDTIRYLSLIRTLCLFGVGEVVLLRQVVVLLLIMYYLTSSVSKMFYKYAI